MSYPFAIFLSLIIYPKDLAIPEDVCVEEF
jgi:hypothetical protein